MQEARFYTQRGEQVRCELCPHYCELRDGQVGRCGVRKAQEGRLIATTYNRVGSVALDPIEKKPLYHFYPGTQILSVGTKGCNLKCQFCQNYRLAHDGKIRIQKISPKELVQLAQKRNSIGIAYTYSEPLVWYEYILDTARKAKKAGLKNVLVTNGVINQKPLKELVPYIDAVNLDVKAMREEFYQDICCGEFESVKKTAEFIYDKVLLEITNLLIPDLNDSAGEIKELTKWIAGLDPNIPFHLARYFPRYKLNKERTSEASMQKAKEIAKKNLNYVYLGNISDRESQKTICPKCGATLIQRGYKVESKLEDGSCPECGKKQNIVF